MMKLKITSNFSWTKLLHYMQNNVAFGETINKYITEPVIKDSKEKIRSNKVKPATTDVTLAKRRARKFPPTISNSTLYDTGKLVNSIRYNKNKKAIYAVDYASYHKVDRYTPPGSIIPDKFVPARDFIDQTHKALSGKSVSASGKIGMSQMEKSQDSGKRELFKTLRRIFSRRLAK